MLDVKAESGERLFVGLSSVGLFQDGTAYRLKVAMPEAVKPPSPPPDAGSIIGTVRADRLVGTSGDDVFDGRGGDDTIEGGDGTDVISGGPGNEAVDAMLAAARSQLQA